MGKAFEWLIDRSNGGDIVVIRVSGAMGYNLQFSSIVEVDFVEKWVNKTAVVLMTTIHPKTRTSRAAAAPPVLRLWVRSFFWLKTGRFIPRKPWPTLRIEHIIASRRSRIRRPV